MDIQAPRSLSTRFPLSSPSSTVRSPYPIRATDRVTIASTPSVSTLADASPDATRLGTAQRWLIIGSVGVAVFGAGIGIGYVLHGTPPSVSTPSTPVTKPITPPVSQPKRNTATPKDQSILKGLDKGGQLFVAGQPVDAFEALRQLQDGKPVQVGIARLGAHPNAYVADPTNAMTADQVKADRDKIVNPLQVTVTDFRDLQRLNSAEKLTDIESDAVLLPVESDAMKQLAGFEGGVPGSHVDKQVAMTGTMWAYKSDFPSPALMSSQHGSQFKPAERLSAYDATGRLLKGQAIKVVSPTGLEQVIRSTDQLQQLSRLELPPANPSDTLDLKTSPEADVSAGLLRELSASRSLVAGASAQDITSGQNLSGFQASQLLEQKKPVQVKLGGGLTAQVSSIADLELLNAEEGLTPKVVTSSLLSPRDQQTMTELTAFEGRADGSQTSLLQMTHSWIHGKDVPSSTRLNARDARAALQGGHAIAVKTPRGHVHVVSNLEELDSLYQMLPSDAKPQPPVVVTPPTTPVAPTDSTTTKPQ